jgi:hypothetical protein
MRTDTPGSPTEQAHTLRVAHDMLQAIGAGAFANRARAELPATGEQARARVPATRDQLIPWERQIALLAADGQTNAAIGAQLFISPTPRVSPAQGGRQAGHQLPTLAGAGDRKAARRGVSLHVRGPIVIDLRMLSCGASGVDDHRVHRLDEPETPTPSGTSIAPAVPGDRADAHSLVGVSTAPAAPLPENHQREQPFIARFTSSPQRWIDRST